MHWLATPLFALACSGSPPPPHGDPAVGDADAVATADRSPAAAPATSSRSTDGSAPGAPPAPGQQPAALTGAVDPAAPAAIPWVDPPATWRSASLDADGAPSAAELLAVIRRVDPNAPTRLVDPLPKGARPPDAWQPRWGRLQTDQPGLWLLWWNQEEPTWVAWDVSPSDGQARRLFAGRADERPDWLVAVSTPPLSTTVDPALARSAAWWDRFTAALQLPADADEPRLALARDPHPAVRGAAIAALTWSLRHASDAATIPARAPAIRALVTELVTSEHPDDRTGAIALALSSLDPDAISSTVPLLCDPDADVAAAALSILAPLLPDAALRPWLVHPRWDIGQTAARSLQRRPEPEPGSPQAAAWPDLRDAAAESWSTAACTPRFSGRYDVAVWSPDLTREGVQVYLRDESGEVIGQGAAPASSSWTRALAMEVDGPPATLQVDIGDETLTETAPAGGGAALGMACTGSPPPPPPVFDADPAEVWRATAASPGRARCRDRVAPVLFQQAAQLPDAPLLDELSTRLSAEEAQAVAARLVHTDRPEPFRRSIAQRFLIPLRGLDCRRGARALLTSDLVSGDLALRLRRCHRQHPELYTEVLEAVEAGRIAVDNLLPMPTHLDEDTRVRIRDVAAAALKEAAPADREGPFRVLMGASGGNPTRGPRHSTVLTLPEGGAAIGLPDPCRGDGDGGFDFVDGTMRLHEVQADDDSPLRVELLDADQAVALTRITCGDRVLWEAPSP